MTSIRKLVRELGGSELDAAVALCMGWRPEIEPLHHFWRDGSPLVSWAVGGQLIDNEHIAIDPLYEGCDYRFEWRARMEPTGYDGHYRETNRWGVTAYGGTPLVAAMRAFVMSKFGDEVDIPA